MKILFITRKYPPIVGGMENYSYNLIEHFQKINSETYFIANSKGNKYIPLFLPSAYKKALNLIKKHNITHVHLCDGFLAPLGNRLKKKTGVSTSITIHGLDITFSNPLYQKYIPKSISKIDKIITVSNYTKEECVKRGLPRDKITFIPNGVNPKEFQLNESKARLLSQIEKSHKLNLKDKKILLTSGRLIKRKGVSWFVINVMPKLPKNYIYLIAGTGSEKEAIEQAVKDNNLQGRVHLLGKVPNNIFKALYNIADSFIMPNIHIEGNAEGFGIVAIEAGSAGLQVIASKIEGIQDAVINGKTGWLVSEKNTNAFINAIKKKPLKESKVRKEVEESYDWKNIIKRYVEVLGR